MRLSFDCCSSRCVVRWIKLKERLFLALLRQRGGRRDIQPPPPALCPLLKYVLRGRERPAGGDVARVGMEGVRTARGRGLYRSHRGGRFATRFQSPFAPVSNDCAGARGGVWVVHAAWEDSPPPASHTHLTARALPPPLPKCGGGGGGEGQEAVFGVSCEARGR